MDDINECNIILAILRYLEKSRRHNTINAFTAFYQIDILNEIVHANYQGTFHILKMCEFLLDLFFGRYIEICRNFMLFNLYVPIMDLIGSFYKNGEQYTIFFQEFDFEFISDSLLLEFVDININIAAAGCMFDIINLKEGDGVKLFFEKDEKYEKFLKFINITIDENTPCRKKIAFYRLSGVIFKNYIWSSIDFNINSFIDAALNSMDQKDNDLAFFSLFALSSLYMRIQKTGSTKDFNNYFIESDGKDIIERLVNEENIELHDQAVHFMENFDRFNK